jgi:hypothetical protein
MVKFKKFMAIFVASSMMLSLAACGDSTSDDDKDVKTDASESKADDSSDSSDSNTDDSSDSSSSDSKKADNIYDALALGDNYTTGNYSFNCSIKGDTEGEAVDLAIGLDGKVDGDNATYGISIKGSYEDTDIDYTFPDVITLADGVLYIDLDSIINAAGLADTEFGAFGIPMPDVEVSNTEDVQATATDFLKAAFDGIDASQDGTEFKIEVTDAESYQKVATNVMNYINDNKDDIQKIYDNAIDSTSNFDTAKYIETLADYYKDDIISAAGLLGYEISADDYDSYADEAVEEVKNELDDLEDEADSAEVDIFEDWDNVMEQFNGLDWDNFAEEFAEGTMKSSLVVDANDSAYKVSFVFNFDYDDVVMDVAIDFGMDVDDVSVGAPSNASSLTDIVNYVINDPDILQLFSDLYSQTGLGSSTYDDYSYDEY